MALSTIVASYLANSKDYISKDLCKKYHLNFEHTQNLRTLE